MIDLHCHVLPGIDDGPATWEQSLALASMSAAGGVRQIVATSHVSPRFPNEAHVIAGLVDELNSRLRGAQIDVEVLPGAEVAITQLGDLPEGELDRLRLGGSGWLLLEAPFALSVDLITALTEDLLERGHRLLLAHPERCPGLHRRPEVLSALAARGVLTSVTAGAFAGRFGRDVQRFAAWMAGMGLVDSVASDAHDLDRRPPGLLEPLEHAGLAAYVDVLTRLVPSALLAGEEPERPGVLVAAPRPRRWRRLRSAW